MSYKHEIESERCKGCGLCINFCPKNVLEIVDKVNAKGHFPVFQVRPDDCIHCAICCIVCPDVAIKITKGEKHTV